MPVDFRTNRTIGHCPSMTFRTNEFRVSVHENCEAISSMTRTMNKALLNVSLNRGMVYCVPVGLQNIQSYSPGPSLGPFESRASMPGAA